MPNTQQATGIIRPITWNGRLWLILLLAALLTASSACNRDGSKPEVPILAAVDVASYLPKEYQRVGDPQPAPKVDERDIAVHVIFYRTNASQGQLLAGYYSGQGDPTKNNPLNIVWQPLDGRARFGDSTATTEPRDMFKGDKGKALLVWGKISSPISYTLSIFRSSLANNANLSLRLVRGTFSGNRGVDIKDLDIIERKAFQPDKIKSNLLCRKGVYTQANNDYPQNESWHYMDFCDERPTVFGEPEEVLAAFYQMGRTGEDASGLLVDPKVKWPKEKVGQFIGDMAVGDGAGMPGYNPANKKAIMVSPLDKDHKPLPRVTWLLAYVPQPEKDKPGLWRIEDLR